MPAARPQVKTCLRKRQAASAQNTIPMHTQKELDMSELMA
jgi:hypothetical protein